MTSIHQTAQHQIHRLLQGRTLIQLSHLQDNSPVAWPGFHLGHQGLVGQRCEICSQFLGLATTPLFQRRNQVSWSRVSAFRSDILQRLQLLQNVCPVLTFTFLSGSSYSRRRLLSLMHFPFRNNHLLWGIHLLRILWTRFSWNVWDLLDKILCVVESTSGLATSIFLVA